MIIISQIEIAKNRLKNLQLVDLKTFSESEKEAFWVSVGKEYLAQFDKLTAS